MTSHDVLPSLVRLSVKGRLVLVTQVGPLHLFFAGEGPEVYWIDFRLAHLISDLRLQIEDLTRPLSRWSGY